MWKSRVALWCLASLGICVWPLLRWLLFQATTQKATVLLGPMSVEEALTRGGGWWTSLLSECISDPHPPKAAVTKGSHNRKRTVSVLALVMTLYVLLMANVFPYCCTYLFWYNVKQICKNSTMDSQKSYTSIPLFTCYHICFIISLCIYMYRWWMYICNAPRPSESSGLEN